MNGSNAPRDGKKWGADVPRERRRFLAHLHRDFRPLAHPLRMYSISQSSPHVPIESPRVARSDPEATGASHSRVTKQSVEVVRGSFQQMFVLRWKHLLKMVSSLGGGCARRLHGSVLFPPSLSPVPVRLKSSWRGGTSSRGVPRASRTPRTVFFDPPRTRSPPRRRDTSTCTTR